MEGIEVVGNIPAPVICYRQTASMSCVGQRNRRMMFGRFRAALCYSRDDGEAQEERDLDAGMQHKGTGRATEGRSLRRGVGAARVERVRRAVGEVGDGGDSQDRGGPRAREGLRREREEEGHSQVEPESKRRWLDTRDSTDRKVKQERRVQDRIASECAELSEEMLQSMAF